MTELNKLRKALRKEGMRVQKKTYSDFTALSFFLPDGHRVGSVRVTLNEDERSVFLAQMEQLQSVLRPFANTELANSTVGIKSALAGDLKNLHIKQ